MKHYAAYCFDLYGTLVDIHTDETRSGFWKALCGVFARMGAKEVPGGRVLREHYLALVRIKEHSLQAAHPGAAVEIELREVFSALLQQMGAEVSAEKVDLLARDFRRLSATHLRAYAGAGELLRSLRSAGAGVYLFSNAQRCFTEPELRSLGLWECFDGIFISSDIGFQKPDPGFYKAALAGTGLLPEDCLMIGNDPVCDILGAVKAGMDAFYVHSGLTPKDAPDPMQLPAVGFLPTMDLRRLRQLLI